MCRPPVCSHRDLEARSRSSHRQWQDRKERCVRQRALARSTRQGPRRDHRRRQLRLLPCAGRALLQGRRSRQSVPGLMHVNLGGYHVRDIEFAAAFDIDAEKVGKDLGKAICPARTTPSSSPRCRQARRPRPARNDPRRARQVPLADRSRRRRARPRTSSGSCARRTPTSSSPTSRSGPSRRRSGTSSRCSRPAARSSTASRSSSLARTTGSKRFEKAGLPIIGDDIKSQVGATIVHRVLARLFARPRGPLERTIQLNVGGNTDFLNMLERERLESKKISKTNAVTSTSTTSWRRTTSTSARPTTCRG